MLPTQTSAKVAPEEPPEPRIQVDRSALDPDPHPAIPGSEDGDKQIKHGGDNQKTERSRKPQKLSHQGSIRRPPKRVLSGAGVKELVKHVQKSGSFQKVVGVLSSPLSVRPSHARFDPDWTAQMMLKHNLSADQGEAIV